MTREISQGPCCRSCFATEARCAWRQGCCSQCTHAFDGEHNEIGPRPLGPEVSRPHGTEAAVRRHYRNGEALCVSCHQAQRRRSADIYRKQTGAA